MSDNFVHHIIVWTESPTEIQMTLGLEGPIVNRAHAEEVAKLYRELSRLQAIHEKRDPKWTRVGILTIEAQLEAPGGTLPPLHDVSDVLARLERRIARLQGTTP